MQDALKKAEAVASNKDAVQTEVDRAPFELSEALRNLKQTELEKEELNSAINSAKSLKKEDHDNQNNKVSRIRCGYLQMPAICRASGLVKQKSAYSPRFQRGLYALVDPFNNKKNKKASEILNFQAFLRGADRI